jgi:hypothetical protein
MVGQERCTEVPMRYTINRVPGNTVPINATYCRHQEQTNKFRKHWGVKYLGSGTNQEAGCRSHNFTFCSFSESPERFRLLSSLILHFFIAVRIIYNKNGNRK